MTAIAIVGAGAIGTMLAGGLASGGHDIRLVGRRGPFGETMVTVREGDVAVEAKVALFPDVKQAATPRPGIRLVIVAVKSYDTATVARELQGADLGEARVLTIQNGVGNEEILSAALGKERIASGAITMPVELSAPMTASVLSRGALGLAPVVRSSGVSDEGEVFSSAGFRVKLFSDYRRLKWTKLLMNLVGNALPAILGWPPERVFSDRRLALVEVDAWREAMRVMDALGIHPVSFGGYPFPLLTPVVKHTPKALVAAALGYLVARGRGGKRPSLLMDMEKGRNRSEVMFLNGAVASHGKKTGVPTPVNACLTEVLLSVARGKTPRETFLGNPGAVLDRCGRE